MKKYSLGIIILFFLFAISGIPAEASIIGVPGDYESIGEAVSSAEPGSIIIVRPGSYSENIIINKPLFLRTSRGAEKTLISAKDPDKPAIHILNTSDVTILGFTIKDSLIAGILVEKSKRIKVNRNLVVHNENGLIFMSVQKGIIYGNHLDSNNSYGLYINKSTECLVSNNTVSYNGDKGFFIFSSDNNVILNNKMNLNRWNGMLIWSSNNNIIKNNKTLRNTFGLVTGESTGNELFNNTSLPDLFLILPVLLIYIGFIFYLVQMYFFKTFSGRQA